jgi:uncharacterized Zn-finger protein
MAMAKGTKLPKGVGHIRLVCIHHKGAQINSAKNSPRQFFPVEANSGSRITCSYCETPAQFISIPENVKISYATALL